MSGESSIGRIIGGRFEVLVGPVAYRGKEGCKNIRCTRSSEVHDRCFGWHCAACDEPSSYQGHLSSGRYVDGEFRRFKNGEWLLCQPGYEEAEVE